jgi:tetratricopeptide (TPR) repeat protein
MKLFENKMQIGKFRIKIYKKLFDSSLKITSLLLIALLGFSALLILSGCKKEAASETTASVSVSASTSAESLAAASTSSSESSSATTGSPSATQDTKETATQSAEESATESTEAVPPDITELIKKADGYYSSGQYGLAKSTYRKAIIAIDDSGLSDEAKQQLKDSIQENYSKSKTIIDTALMHFGNAMQLEYETRYEEAKRELEAALAIYPKYADAIEAYDNLKAIMGLE